MDLQGAAFSRIRYERDANRVENDRIIFLILAMIFALKNE